MVRRLILPPPALRSLVQVYWLMDEHLSQAEQHVFLPEQLAHLTFSSGRSWVIGAGGVLTLLPPATLEGLVTAPTRLFSEGAVRTLRAELYPWAARQLFGWSYPDAALDLLAGAAGSGAARTARAIQAALVARDDEAALALLSDWLLALASGRQAARAGRAWTAGEGVRAAVRLYHSGGQRRVAELASESELSPRTLERLFVQEVGVGAKTLARLIRFETAHNALAQGPQTPLVTLAHDLGFSDQAHLTREFRALGGLTPATFARLSDARNQKSAELDGSRHDPRVLLPPMPP
ncbi:helix-turn-helix domain-containing protein [Deinococcus yavapaiensis]|nr:helix-turn-helix domain-containing protein [Deinococcus yavapaiensis]